MNGVSSNNVTTSSVSVSPQRRYNSTTGVSVVTGYQFSNYINVKLSGVTGDGVAAVLDAAVRSADNITVSNIAFSLSPALSYNRTVAARSQAAADAKSTAQQYAQVRSCCLRNCLLLAMRCGCDMHVIRSHECVVWQHA